MRGWNVGSDPSPLAGTRGGDCVVLRGKLLWPPCVADADNIFMPCGFFFFLSSSSFFLA